MPTKTVKYNPAFLSDNELINSFVVRQADLMSLIDIVRENTGNANQHVLVLGPRGCGKTTLVRRVALDVSRDPHLRGLWYPVIFAEESYQVTTPGEFWLEAAFHLAHQTQNADWMRTYQEVGKQWRDEDQMRERALGLLMDFADQKERRFLLIVENVNMLFGEQISDDDAWKLRHTLLNEPRVMLLATATSRFDEIDHPEKALYEVFRPHGLRPLDIGECRTFWQARTGDLLIDDRIRPIEILTGGNVRLLTILADFGARISLRQLMTDLVHLVDDHTEYFKSHLDALPPIERKVYLALAELWDPSPARDVAEVARLDVNKTSTLLQRLEKRGAVSVLDKPGRTKWYQLSERMYNIYYLLRRRGGPSQRVRAVVRFMVEFYDASKLVSIADRIATEIAELAADERKDHFQAYYDLVEQTPAGEVRNKLVEVGRDRLTGLKDLPSPLAVLIKSDQLKPSQGRVTIEATKGDDPSVEAESLVKRAWELGTDPSASKEAEQLCRQAIKADPEYAPAWTYLGAVLYDTSTRFTEAEEAIRKAIEIDARHASAWLLLGRILHEKLSRFNEAEEAYRTAIEYDPDSACAWGQLGQLLHENLSRFDEAEKAYRRAIEISPEFAWAWGQLGQLLHEKVTRFEEAEEAYRKAIEINPDRAWVWAKLGQLLEDKLMRPDEAEAAYRKVIVLAPDYVLGYSQMTRLLLKTERESQAQQLADEAISRLPDQPGLLNSFAWNVYEFGSQNMLPTAKQWATEAVEHDGQNGWYQHTLATIQSAMGRLGEALSAAREYLADGNAVAMTVDDAINLFVDLAARGKAKEAVRILTQSPSADQLEPLIVGLRIYLGESQEVAVEIKEIGTDVARRVENRVAELTDNADSLAETDS